MRRTLTWELPDWIFRELDLEVALRSDEDKMRLAIALARRNMAQGGGPFAAVVIDRGSGLVVAPGVNLVLQQGCSLLHAEVVAIAFAQAQQGSYSLAAGDHELVTSSEPCVQCLGAVYWSGLRRVVCGAPLAAAEAAGFDEGPRSDRWIAELGTRGIEVVPGVLPGEAGEVLAEYARRGGIVYDPRRAAASS